MVAALQGHAAVRDQEFVSTFYHDHPDAGCVQRLTKARADSSIWGIVPSICCRAQSSIDAMMRSWGKKRWG